MFNKINASQLAAAVGCHRATIYEWLKQGMPRNGDKSFSLPKVIDWMLEREREGMQDQAMTATDSPALERYREARAKMAELDLKERSGELIDAQHVGLAWADRVSFVRQSMDALGSRLAPILLGKTREELQKIIEDAHEYIFIAFARHGEFTPAAFAEFGKLEQWLNMTWDEKQKAAEQAIKNLLGENADA